MYWWEFLVLVLVIADPVGGTSSPDISGEEGCVKNDDPLNALVVHHGKVGRVDISAEGRI